MYREDQDALYGLVAGGMLVVVLIVAAVIAWHAFWSGPAVGP